FVPAWMHKNSLHGDALPSFFITRRASNDVHSSWNLVHDEVVHAMGGSDHHSGSMMLPPQNCDRMGSATSPWIRATCQGLISIEVGKPPTILGKPDSRRDFCDSGMSKFRIVPSRLGSTSVGGF